jgi:hypothetical protein
VLNLVFGLKRIISMCILYVFLQVLCIDWFFVNYFMSLFQNVSKVGVLNSVFDLKCTLVVEW